MSTSFRALAEKFIQWEADARVWELRISGEAYWKDIRLQVWARLAEYKNIQAQGHNASSRSLKAILSFGLKAFVNFLLSFPKYFTACDYVVIGHGRRKRLSDSRDWDLFWDPIEDSVMGWRGLYVERPYRGQFFSNIQTSHTVYFTLEEQVCKICSRLFPKTLDLEPLQKLRRVEESFSETFGLTDPIVKRVCDRVSLEKFLLPLYRLFLSRVGSRLLVMVASGGKETWLRAARSVGIKSLELQHGVLDRFHFSYSFPLECKNKLAFPDFFASFGPYWEGRAMFPIAQENVFSMGYPYLEKVLSETKPFATEQPYVIVVSQATQARSLSQILCNFLEAHPNPLYRFIVKLHPGEGRSWAKDYSSLREKFADQVEFVDGDQPSLYSMLLSAQGVLGVNSTALWEALWVGRPVALFNLPGIEYLEDLSEQGLIGVLSNNEEIASWMSSLSQYSRPKESLEIFKPYERKRMVDTMERLLSRKGANTHV